MFQLSIAGLEIMRNTVLSIVLFVLFTVSIPLTAFCKSNEADAQARATNISGDVRIQREGSLIWEKVSSDQILSPGSKIKTKFNSSVVISFSDGSYLKLPPMSSIKFDNFENSSGASSNIVSMDSGKFWLRAKANNVQNPFFIEVPGGLIDTADSTMFVESDYVMESTCVDVFFGSAEFRSQNDPSQAVALQKNKRILIQEDSTPDEPWGIDSVFDTENNKYSCMEQAAAEKLGSNLVKIVEEQDDYIQLRIVSSANVKFDEIEKMDSDVQSIIESIEEVEQYEYVTITISKSASVTFTKCNAAGESCAADEDCCGSSYCENNICVEVEAEPTETIDESGLLEFTTETPDDTSSEEVEYETIVVSVSSSVIFKETVCENEPLISEIIIDGQAVSDGSSISIQGEPCATSKKTELSWKIAPRCGYITSTSLSAADATKEMGSVEEGNIGTFKANITFPGTERLNFSISTQDSFNNTSSVSFSAQLEPGESLAEKPSISDVIYGENSLSSGSELSITIDSCDEASFSISGKAETTCGEISQVVFTQDGSQLQVSGTGEWSASHKVPSAEGQSSFEIKAVNSLGVESDPFTFSLSYQVNEELLAPPALSSITLDGNPVSEGESIEIVFDSCNTITSTLAGKAACPCGEISEILVTRNGQQETVEGTGDWSASLKKEPTGSDETNPVSIKAINSAGAESEPLEFDLAYSYEIEPPLTELQTISGKAIEDLYTPMELWRDEIEDGKIVIRGAAMSEACTISRVEVSIDDGSSWETAEGTNNWTYDFAPSEQTYYIQARAFDAVGTESEEQIQSLEVTYNQYSQEENLLEIFHQLIQAYIDKNSSAFTELTSSNFTSDYEGIEDLNSLETSLDNKFVSVDEIYLRYQVDSVTVSGTSGQVSFSWDARQSTSGYSQYAVFYFEKEEEGWRFSNVQDDNTFLRYTSVVASIILEADETTIVADGDAMATITAEVRDSAYNLIKDGTVISFITSTGSITAEASTTNGFAEASFSYTSKDPVTAEITAYSGEATSSPLYIEIEREFAPGPPGE